MHLPFTMRHVCASNALLGAVLFAATGAASVASTACSGQIGGGGTGNPGSPDGGTGGLPDAPPGCMPTCTPGVCGDDGCGGVCNPCSGTDLCQSGMCSPVTDGIQVDPTAQPHTIHPEIYGLAYASPATIAELGTPLNRWGGNGSTLYNWQLDVHNTANDWYFENIVGNPGDSTFGTPAYQSDADRFVAANHAAGADSLIAVPTIGWTPKDRAASGHTCGFPKTKYPSAQGVDPYDANCGNGKDAAGNDLTPDPTNDAMTVDPSFEGAWLAHLTATFGNAAAGGVRWYSLDNEMMLWDSTHRDVHPQPVTFDEVWQATLAYAPAIRAADPNATLLGYGTWGVLDLFDSGLDGKNNGADRAAHGGMPLAQWYLAQLATYQAAHGTRLVDCLDIHYYPQGGDSLANTRSLWDATYRDPSWVDSFLGEPVRLLPRVGEWIASTYPGTGICISEYNFNLNDPQNPSASLAEADVLGIFGKYGVRMATYWTTPVDNMGVLQPAGYGMKMFRNFDGAGGRFADVSIGAATSLPDVVVYAATDAATDKVTVLVINKGTAPVTTGVALTHFAPGAAAQVWQHVAGGTTITHAADAPITAARAAVTLPASSITMLVVPKS